MSATPGTWETFSYDGMQYEMLLPYNYSPSQQYPLLLFLHGGGQEYEIPALIDPWFNTAAFRSDYPAIVIAPILPNASMTVTWGGYPTDGTANSAGENQALAIVQQVMATYPVNQNQVYVTGLSLGGVSTWDLMIKYDAYDGLDGRIFAAGVSMFGGEWSGPFGANSLPSPAVVSELQNVPIWAITGNDAPGDDWDIQMAADLPNGAYHFTYDSSVVGEDVWDTFYPLPTGAPIYNWLFSQSAGAPAGATSASIVTSLYQQILGRAPDTPGLAYWEQQLDNGVPESALASALAQSPEASADIAGFYEQVLGRAVDSGGLAWWEQALADGSSLATARAEIAGSAEAQGDIGAAYEQILGRAVDSGGLAWWEQTLSSGSTLATVRADIAGSAEAQGDISAVYEQILDRSADAGGLAWWQQALANGSNLTTVRADIAGSAEAQGDVGAFYEQILGRPADPAGLAWWEQTLANGSTLTMVASAIADSSEATADLTGAYHAVYGIAPNQGILATLQGRLLGGATLSSVENSLHAPLIFDTVAGQAINDQSTVQPFGVASVDDSNAGDTETATITLTDVSDTATDADGILSGVGLIHSGAGTYTLSSGSAAGLTTALNALVFTPITGEVAVGQSVTTDMSISVNDTVATGSDTVTSVTATAVTSPTNLDFIYGSSGSDTFTEAASPAVIGENVDPKGNDVVVNFNIAQDVVQLSAAMFATYAAVEVAISNVNGNAVIRFDSSDSLALQGVAPGNLTANNFSFV